MSDNPIWLCSLIIRSYESVSQLLKRFNALYDSILLYDTENIKALCQFVLFSNYKN